MRLALKAYDPDQPRAPGGTEEAGQWVSEGGNELVVAGGFSKDEKGMSVQDFIARKCKGSIYEELPSQFLPFTIEELLQMKKNGVVGSDTCYKLLNQNRYRK